MKLSNVAAIHQQSKHDGEAPAVDAAADTTLVRTARVSWLASPPCGHGTISLGSRAVMAVPFTEPRAQGEPRITDPSELFAAAHAGAVAVTVSRLLDANQTGARELVVTANLEYAGDGHGVKAIEFSIQGRVPRINASQFEDIVYSAIERYRREFGVDLRGTVSVHTALI